MQEARVRSCNEKPPGDLLSQCLWRKHHDHSAHMGDCQEYDASVQFSTKEITCGQPSTCRKPASRHGLKGSWFASVAAKSIKPSPSNNQNQYSVQLHMCTCS